MNDSQLPAVCSNCGAPLPTSDWHPIRATTDAKGEFAVHGFCDEDCLEEWVASQDGST